LTINRYSYLFYVVPSRTVPCETIRVVVDAFVPAMHLRYCFLVTAFAVLKHFLFRIALSLLYLTHLSYQFHAGIDQPSFSVALTVMVLLAVICGILHCMPTSTR